MDPARESKVDRASEQKTLFDSTLEAIDDVSEVSRTIVCGLWAFPFLQAANTVGVFYGVSIFKKYVAKVNFWGYNLQDLGWQQYFDLAVWGTFVFSIVTLFFAIINCDFFQAFFPRSVFIRCWGSHIGRATWILLFFITFGLSLALVGTLVVTGVIVVIFKYMKEICDYLPTKDIAEVINLLTSTLHRAKLLDLNLNITANKIAIECPKIGGNIEIPMAEGIAIIFVFQQFIFAMCSWNAHKAQVRIENENAAAMARRKAARGADKRGYLEATWGADTRGSEGHGQSVELAEAHREESASTTHYQRMGD
jgi:hypothetical protein